MENSEDQDDQSVERHNEQMIEEVKTLLLAKDPTLDWSQLRVEPDSVHRFVGIGSDDAETNQKFQAAMEALIAEKGGKGECDRQ